MGKPLKIFAAGVVLFVVCSLALFLRPQVNPNPNHNPLPSETRPGAPEGYLTAMYEVEVYPDVNENLAHAHVIVLLPVVDNQVPKLAKVENDATGNFTYSWRYVSEPYSGIEIFVDGMNFEIGEPGEHGELTITFYYHVPIGDIPKITVPVQPEPGTTVIYAEWDGGPRGWFIVHPMLTAPVPDKTHSVDEVYSGNFPHNDWDMYGCLEGRRPGWYLLGLPPENFPFAPYLGPTFPENLL
jgi:hypothetical protein